MGPLVENLVGNFPSNLVGRQKFTPWDIASEGVSWLDFSREDLIVSSGSSVHRVHSLIGPEVIQDLAASRPTTGATQRNGLNVLDFDGGDLLYSETAPSFTAGRDWTWFMVAAVTNANQASDSIFSYYTNFNNDIQLQTDQPGRWRPRTFGYTNLDPIDSNISYGQYSIVIVRSESGSGAETRVNGEPRSNAPILRNVNPGGILRIFANRGGGSAKPDGHAAEFGWFRGGDVNKAEYIESYLSEKWAVPLWDQHRFKKFSA